MFLANSVQFGSLNEVVTFIHNVITEKRTYKDRLILDDDITLEEAFYKVCSNCGFEWIPTEKELLIIWEIMMKLSQEDLNRIFYKNNLYSFMDNKVPTNAIITLLQMLDKPYLDPNSVPDEIKDEISLFWDMLGEYVYYGYQIIDRADRLSNMIRSVTAIIDTDSNIISLDAWYHYILDKVKDIPMKIYAKANTTEFVAGEDFDMATIKMENKIEFEDFNFYDDDITMSYRMNTNPVETTGQDNLRYSIINILCYCLGEMINNYMVKYTENSHSAADDRKCLMIMKNEFLFSRALLTNAKKTYASIQELQEGKIVNKVLDVKGLDVLTKSTTNEATRERLREIMYEDILKTPNIDQLTVLKHMAITEKKMFNSLSDGSKEFYKPAVIKSISNYDDPMRIQGIKGSIAYNALRGEFDETIDLEKRNAIDIIKVNITPTNIEKIKESHPDAYEKLFDLINNNENFKSGIKAISIPLNVETPKWILEFIDYKTIINDNIAGFPLESIGLCFAGGNVNYTNILKI